MNKLSTIIFLAISNIVMSNFALAQHDHSHVTSAEDSRIAVEFPESMKQHTLTSMRDHLLAISQIQEAIGNGQYDQAAHIAETRLGQSALKSHHALESSKFMPKGMQDIGSQMHRSASKFAVEVQNSSATGDVKQALLALSKTTQSCVACHSAYKLK